MDTTAIQSAVETVGGQTAFAREIGRSQGLVWQWCDGRLAVPAEYCRPIEQLIDRHLARAVEQGRMTKAQALESRVTRYALRPDVFGDAPAIDLQEAG